MRRKLDRRVERTQQVLRGALLSLIQERGFETLTVQEIIDRANVGRATFYTHFDNKNDLLASGFEVLRASLKERQREAQSRPAGVDERVFAFTHELFVHVSDHRNVFRAMVGKKSAAIVQQSLHRIVVELVREDVMIALRGAEPSIVPEEALVQFLAGACFGVMMWWLESRRRMTPEDVNHLFRRLAIPAVKAARREK